MKTMFSSHNGGVVSTAIVKTRHSNSEPEVDPDASPSTPKMAAVGGQLGSVTAAINLVGWNKHKVPANERVVT